MLGEGIPAAFNGINEVFVQKLAADELSFQQALQGYLKWSEFLKKEIQKNIFSSLFKKTIFS